MVWCTSWLWVYVGEEERQAKIDLLKKTWTNLFQGAEWYDQRTSGNGATYVEAIAYPSVLTDKYNPYFNNAYDFQNMFYQTGQTGNYDLSMEGGNENNSYRVSLAHYDETGVLKGYGLSRTNLSMSLVTDVNKWIHNEVVMRYSYVNRDGGLGDVMKAMPTSPHQPPVIPVLPYGNGVEPDVRRPGRSLQQERLPRPYGG